MKATAIEHSRAIAVNLLSTHHTVFIRTVITCWKDSLLEALHAQEIQRLMQHMKTTASERARSALVNLLSSQDIHLGSVVLDAWRTLCVEQFLSNQMQCQIDTNHRLAGELRQAKLTGLLASHNSIWLVGVALSNWKDLCAAASRSKESLRLRSAERQLKAKANERSQILLMNLASSNDGFLGSRVVGIWRDFVAGQQKKKVSSERSRSVLVNLLNFQENLLMRIIIGLWKDLTAETLRGKDLLR